MFSRRTLVLPICAALFFLAGIGSGFFFARRESPTKKDVAAAFSQLRDDVASLLRAVRPELPAISEDPDDRPADSKSARRPASRSDVQSELTLTRRTIADGIKAALSARRSPEEKQGIKYNLRFDHPQSIEWKTPQGTFCRNLLVANEGPSIASNISIVLDGEALPATSVEIAGRIAGDSVEETRKAVALWKSVVDGRCHDWPAHKEAEDPVKLLGVYGYGFCSHAAHSLAALARHAGLESRVLQARGKHLVTEIMVDGRWAVFDADAEAFYPMPGGLLASAEDIRANPGLLTSSPSRVYSEAKPRDFYTASDIVESKPSVPPESHSLRVKLRPGESIIYSRDRIGLFFSSRYLDEPREYANGEWVFKPQADGDMWLRGCKSSRNVRSIREGDRCFLAPTEPGLPAQVTYAFVFPYPALDGKIQVKTKGGRPSIEISRDGSTWQVIQPSESGKSSWDFSLGDYLHRVSGDPDYKFDVRLTLPAGSVSESIQGLVYRFGLQMAPRYLPIPSETTSSIGLDFSSDGPVDLNLQTACTKSGD